VGVGGSGSLIAGGSSLFFLFRSRSVLSGGFIVSDIRGVDKGVILGVEAKNDFSQDLAFPDGPGAQGIEKGIQ